jgi:hypothetical protein
LYPVDAVHHHVLLLKVDLARKVEGFDAARPQRVD